MGYWDDKEAEAEYLEFKKAEKDTCGCCCCTGSCMDDIEDTEDTQS
jgi:hypothetical protein